MDLSYNQLSGPIPPTLVTETLDRLVLEHNQLSGSIPVELVTNTPSDLNLSHNQLSGTLPDFRPSSFSNLDFSYNQFTGPIPSGFWNFRRVEDNVDLSHNALTGALPDWDQVGEIQGTLDLSHNQFTGAIPQAFTSLTSLSGLDVKPQRTNGDDTRRNWRPGEPAVFNSE